MENVRSIKRIGELERRYVEDVLSSEFRSRTGAKYMRLLEETFAEIFGTNFAVCFVNGTATMHSALEAMGIGPGDEVIVPPLTMSATSFAVLQANATPVFADVDPETFQISAKSISQRVTSKTKAIITVALYGLSPDMDPIREIASENSLKIIEDNAECFLGEYKGQLAGTLGDCASFSFQSSKHLSSGEGGIVITNEEDLASRLRRVGSLGYAGVGASEAKISKLQIQEPDYSRHVSMGWNYRMPELCCAVALAQVQRIEELVNARIVAANLFNDAVEDFANWFVPQVCPDHSKNSYWTWVCVNKHPEINWGEIRNAFLKLGGDGIYGAWKLSYLEPMFQNKTLLGREKFISNDRAMSYKEGLCPTAEYLQPRLMQFKTNYWDEDDAKKQAEYLHKTLRQFN